MQFERSSSDIPSYAVALIASISSSGFTSSSPSQALYTLPSKPSFASLFELSSVFCDVVSRFSCSSFL